LLVPTKISRYADSDHLPDRAARTRGGDRSAL